MKKQSDVRRLRFRAVVIVPVAALALAAAGVSAASSMHQSGARHSTSSVAVKTRKIDGKVVLVNAAGHTLYAFMKDARKKVTCTGSCASYWPPLKQKGTAKATAGGAAKQSLIGSDKDPSGGRVVTYNGWPLYTYVSDQAAGSATGEGLNLNGGRWYVLSPTGVAIKSLKASSGGGTTTTGGGGGWG